MSEKTWLEKQTKKPTLREALMQNVKELEEELAQQKQQNDFLMALLVEIYENVNIMDLYTNIFTMVEAVIYEGRPECFGGGEISYNFAKARWHEFKQMVLEGKKPTRGV
jgi:hypothetical protein